VPKPGRRENPLSQKEKSRLSTGPSADAKLGSELAAALTLLVGFLALAVRILALTVWILLLLSGLLATTLLLTGFLPGILVLLARILVLIGHRDLPCCMSRESTRASGIGCRNIPGSSWVIGRRPLVWTVAVEPVL
jgi:hypothetical protein